jgi:hypothetical protein
MRSNELVYSNKYFTSTYFVYVESFVRVYRTGRVWSDAGLWDRAALVITEIITCGKDGSVSDNIQ